MTKEKNWLVADRLILLSTTGLGGNCLLVYKSRPARKRFNAFPLCNESDSSPACCLVVARFAGR